MWPRGPRGVAKTDAAGPLCYVQAPCASEMTAARACPARQVEHFERTQVRERAHLKRQQHMAQRLPELFPLLGR